MILTSIHADYWRSKQKAPAWVQAQDTKHRNSKVSIHDCINAHAGIRVVISPAQNTMAILRGYRRRKGSVLSILDQMAAHPETTIRPASRAAFSKKWAARIRKGL